MLKVKSRTEISNNDPKVKRLRKLQGELDNLLGQMSLLEESQAERKVKKEKQDKLEKEIKKLNSELETIRSNKIYENAFEWRFEFPEVLNDEGNYLGFDAVIGNPPYGVKLDRKTRKLYQKEYQTFTKDSYTLFIEKAVNILNLQGYLGFIIPDTLLNLDFTKATRYFILKNTHIHEIDLLPSNVFSDSTVDPILLFFRKKITRNKFNKNEVLVKVCNKKDRIDNLDKLQRKFRISTAIWYEEKAFNLQSTEDEITIIQRIDSKFPLLVDYSELFYGIKAYQVGKGKPPQTTEIKDTKPFTSNKRKDENWLPFFDGEHIGRYQLLWKEDNWLNYGSWLAEPRVPEKFENEKILIRKITGKTLIAHYITHTSYCNTLLFVLKLKPEVAQISYKALLGIINSSFIGWYFRKKFQINEEDTFPQINIGHIKQFAIPNENNEITQRIEKIVDSILESKILNMDTTALEKEIDQVVYQLYNLTEEEIIIVEDNCGR